MAVADNIRQALSSALADAGVELAPESVPLEHPAELSHGDYASGVSLAKAKEAGINPRALAEKLVASLGAIPGVAKIGIAGPGFINFTLAPSVLTEAVENARSSDDWGKGHSRKGEKIMVEYTDPNPFKEFHIGHLMSNAIGESTSRLLKFTGADVKHANYQGDVGPHVAKAIWGIQKLGLDASDSKQLGKAYTTGSDAYDNDSTAKAEIESINAKVYDRSDNSINEIYDAGRDASLAHFEEIYALLGTKFDFYFFESKTAPKGMATVKAHPEIFEESDGALVYHGESEGLHTRVFVTSKGLPTYETKDLGLIQLKAESWDFDTSITVTATEQKEYFRVVLAAMNKVLPELAKKVRHVSHGMMRLAEGKMSSRKGNVITGESLIEELVGEAKARAAESRAEDHELLAKQIAVAAIKYQILKQASGKDITFDRERALSLEGDSGPYLQYAYARTVSLLEKIQTAKAIPSKTIVFHADIKEVIGAHALRRLLVRFPEIVERAAHEMEPHHLTTYLLGLVSVFNSWYASERIIVEGEVRADIPPLVEAMNRTLKNSLWILGIPAPDKM